MQQLLHMRKWIILSGKARLVLLHIYQLNYTPQQEGPIHGRTRERESRREKIWSPQASLQSGSEYCRCCSTGVQLDFPQLQKPPSSAAWWNYYTNRRAVFCTSLLSDLRGQRWLYHSQHKLPKNTEDVKKKKKNPNKHWKTLLGSIVNIELEKVKGFPSGKILWVKEKSEESSHSETVLRCRHIFRIQWNRVPYPAPL